MVAIVLYAISTLAWIVALRTLPLSKAYLFLACGFILVPLGAHFIIDEPLSPRLVTGSILVALGVWVAVSN